MASSKPSNSSTNLNDVCVEAVTLNSNLKKRRRPISPLNKSLSEEDPSLKNAKEPKVARKRGRPPKNPAAGPAKTKKTTKATRQTNRRNRPILPALSLDNSEREREPSKPIKPNTRCASLIQSNESMDSLVNNASSSSTITELKECISNSIFVKNKTSPKSSLQKNKVIGSSEATSTLDSSSKSTKPNTRRNSLIQSNDILDVLLNSGTEKVVASTSAAAEINIVNVTKKYSLSSSSIKKPTKKSNLQKNKVLSTSQASFTTSNLDNSNNVNILENEMKTNEKNVNVNTRINNLNDNTTTITTTNNNVNYSLKELFNNANLYYNNYNKKKLDFLNNELTRSYFENANRCGTTVEIVKNDVINMKTPLPYLNWAHNIDIWKLMRLKDLHYHHDFHYLKKHTGIDSKMRSILIDWLAEICFAYRLHRETFHLSLEYIDRFMTSCTHKLAVDRLQLLGLTSLFLAAKVEEIYPPKLREFATHMENYSNNNEMAMQEFELFILKTLNWQISPVTANTWLMTYLQIASINYYSLISNINNPVNRISDETENVKVFNTHIVMPINFYKNSNLNLRDYLKQLNKGHNCNSNQTNEINSVNMKFSSVQQTFFLNNYLKAITLLDLCLFDIESLMFNYSVLAASALYHMISIPNAVKTNASFNDNDFINNAKVYLIEQCTGYKIDELNACIKWMVSYADASRVMITEEKMIEVVKKFDSTVEQDNTHNIQYYYQYMDVLKVAQSRKTPCEFNSSSNSCLQILLTPPGSVHKYTVSNSVSSSISPI